jgi:hypothetical protein
MICRRTCKRWASLIGDEQHRTGVEGGQRLGRKLLFMDRGATEEEEEEEG